jgi:hypothetical protein
MGLANKPKFDNPNFVNYDIYEYAFRDDNVEKYFSEWLKDVNYSNNFNDTITHDRSIAFEFLNYDLNSSIIINSCLIIDPVPIQDPYCVYSGYILINDRIFFVRDADRFDVILPTFRSKKFYFLKLEEEYLVRPSVVKCSEMILDSAKPILLNEEDYLILKFK